MKNIENTSPENLIIFELTRNCIEEKQIASILEHWAPDKLPQGPALRLLMNSMFFHLEGYADDPRPICTIPEVRSFCQAYYEAWPFWFFYANLDNPSLLVLVFACLQNLGVRQEKAKESCCVRTSRAELNDFVQRGVAGMACLCKQAGMSDSEICLRSMQIVEYFYSRVERPIGERD